MGGTMYRYRKLLLCVLSLFVFASCEAEPRPEVVNVMWGKDHNGPVLLKTEASGEDLATYHFDEMVFCSSKDFSVVDSDNRIVSVQPYEKRLHIRFIKPLVAGERIKVNGVVRDRVGNSLTFSAGVWGYNGSIPTLLINEFSTKGTESNPDRIELLALSKGNLAGVALYVGMPGSFDSELVFPDVEVEEGERIVVYYGYLPQGETPLEWYGGETGIGANNGVISLCASPDGRILDAVMYSNRTSDSDVTYDGFGTAKVQQWAQELEQSGYWKPHPNTPETGIDSSDTTATRSFCRTEGEDDTDSKDDWHIVPTRGASFGLPNTEATYR
jgi:hypothetical protein